MRTELIRSSILAYLGDSVLELIVREFLVKESGLVKMCDFQKEAIKYVSAESHAAFMHEMITENFFSEKEINIYKRGRNTKGGKNESVEHMHSTGLEAIIGTLYLEEDYERLNEIFRRYREYIDTK